MILSSFAPDICIRKKQCYKGQIRVGYILLQSNEYFMWSHSNHQQAIGESESSILKTSARHQWSTMLSIGDLRSQ